MSELGNLLKRRRSRNEYLKQKKWFMESVNDHAISYENNDVYEAFEVLMSVDCPEAQYIARSMDDYTLKREILRRQLIELDEEAEGRYEN